MGQKTKQHCRRRDGRSIVETQESVVVAAAAGAGGAAAAAAGVASLCCSFGSVPLQLRALSKQARQAISTIPQGL